MARAIKIRKSTHFLVASKWIYPLPVHPSLPNSSDYDRKNEVLVVTDMNITSREESAKAWRTVMTESHLQDLYAIITLAGGSSYRPDNVAFTHSGKFAFIDTEYPHLVPSYSGIAQYLSPEMAKVWEKIVKKGRL